MTDRTGLLRIAAVTVVAGSLLVACSQPQSGVGSASAAASPSSGTPASSVSVPSQTASSPAVSRLTQVTTQLDALAVGRTVTVIAVGTGFEAAALDQAGDISFWKFTSAWRQVGSSSYPAGGPVPGPSDATAQAAVLTGMSDASFILQGTFSTDGSNNAASYTNGRKGWGAIKAVSDGNISPSGQGVTFGGIGLENGFYFSSGLLETADCSKTLAIAQCGGANRVLKFWRWNGSELTLASRSGLPR